MCSSKNNYNNKTKHIFKESIVYIHKIEFLKFGELYKYLNGNLDTWEFVNKIVTENCKGWFIIKCNFFFFYLFESTYY